jgi:PhnB protein
MKNHPLDTRAITFVPMLYLRDLAAAIEFYKNAFGAIELRRTEHEGRVHVAELSINDALFRMHEEVTREKELSPGTLGGTTVVIGLFVDDPDGVAAKAVAAGGREISPVQDYDYGYRQGTIQDPFGHHWLIEKK